MAARQRFRNPEGVLRVWWFAVILVAFLAVCLGLAAIGGWAGIAAVVAAQLVVIAVIIVTAHPGREGLADPPVGVVPGKPLDSGAGEP